MEHPANKLCWLAIFYLEDLRFNIKYYREQKGISQAQLSIFCDCGTGTIGGIESGKAKPSLDMLLRIADSLGVTPADLFIRNVSCNKNFLKEKLKKEFALFLERV
ncbi:MAG: helix-turn-helix transcriptional regulator [Treponema sp.]|nr:helix-turn-helix transcriptional regulator [Treponema sp.]